jgi:hypothetical protein
MEIPVFLALILVAVAILAYVIGYRQGIVNVKKKVTTVDALQVFADYVYDGHYEYVTLEEMAGIAGVCNLYNNVGVWEV